MEQHIANIINHCITTGEEGLGPTSLNTKRVGAALRDVFPLQAALGLDVPPQSSTCSAERAPGAFAVTRFTFGVQRAHCTQWGAASTLRAVSQCCKALCPGPTGKSREGNWHHFSSPRLCKTGVKAIARKRKTKQALWHTSHCSPCSTAALE